MPRGNRTGPDGMGPMTGRGAGYCAGYNMPGYANPTGGRGSRGRGQGFGRGFGRGYGRGMGRGFGRGYGYDDQYYDQAPYYPPAPYYPGTAPVYQEPAPEEEKVYLENMVKGMETELEDIKARIKELAKKEK